MGQREETLAALPPMTVANGTYTVEKPDGGHATVKLYTPQRGKLQGRRLLAILTGPDNTSSYTPVAFWDGEKELAFVWKRYQLDGRGGRIDGYNWPKRVADWSRESRVLAVWLDLALRGESGYWGQAGYRLLCERRCVLCNRKLTTPESIERGIGPDCAAKGAA